MIRRAVAVGRREWRFLFSTHIVAIFTVHPALSALVLGLLASLDIVGVRAAVVDARGDGPAIRRLERSLEASSVFRIAERPASPGELERQLLAGRVDVGFVTGAGRQRPLLVVADGADPNVAGLGLAYATRVAEAGQARATQVSRIRTWYNPSLRSRDMLLVGAIVFSLVWFAQWVGESLLVQRDRGTLARLRSSPLRPVELWLGTVLPYCGVGLVCALLQTGLAVFVLDVPFRGDSALLVATCLALVLIHANLGCALTLIVRRSHHCAVLTFLLAFIGLALAGYFQPGVTMPGWARAAGDLVPLKHGLVLLRAVFLKGERLESLPTAGLVLGGFVVASSGLAYLSVRRLLRDRSSW